MLTLNNDTELRAGSATLEVRLVAGQSAVTSLRATNPLKLLTPRARGPSVWAYTSSFGGGLVAGDRTQLDLSLGEKARCFLATQASTKVYRNPNELPCSHSTMASLGADSLLIFAPDPVQPFSGSIYTQRQEFRLESGASLMFIDWFTSGRFARGERWEFNRFETRAEIFIENERVFLDALLLSAGEGPLINQHRTGRFNCFATLVVIGPALERISQALLIGIGEQPVHPRSSLISSVSGIRGGAVARFAGEDVEMVGRVLQPYLFNLTEKLGDNPWMRKW